MRAEERVLLLQRGEAASALDEVVGMVDTAELAGKVAEAWNAFWPAPDPGAGPSVVERVKAEAENRAREEQADLEG